MTAATPHPFSHLGPAPYRFVGLQTTEDREELNRDLERAGKTFTTNMCGGSCDHCGTAIWNVYTFEAANGVRFKVGETCAQKAGEGAQVKEGRKSHDRERRERISRIQREAARNVERARNEALGHGYFTDIELANMAARAAEARRQEWRDWTNANSAHIGAVGERMRGVVVRYEGHYSFDSAFGIQTLFFLRTLDGHALVWKTGAGLDRYRMGEDGMANCDSEILKGECFLADFSIKKHGEYKGQKQTTITRLAQPKPKAPKKARKSG